jgi:hypothetical protein
MRHIPRKTGKNIACPQCGKIFYAAAWELRANRQCCSEKCASDFRRKGIVQECPICHKSFYRRMSKIKLGAKYCSKRCFYIAYPTHPQNILDKMSKSLKGHLTPQPVRNKISLSQKNKPRPYTTGTSNGMWKGDDVSYGGLHSWVARKIGKAKICKHCGKSGTGRQIHWANISRKYLRDVNDWMSLCVACHKKYDCQNL